ncbi:DUF1800 domain-containing protein [Bowmanella yangjiangensis]|uniref:DUF1800 family protein n=1 Tax=Bowmanella yangjiangensis TaxID=2811230 RepID=A0ABS3CUZ9_9ALTE|nr:DUF1800 family protein [Bowmanella yangjiangensis]MBN7819976.1 DUF1800 family protein [Bowmanella yangjiangensis]
MAACGGSGNETDIKENDHVVTPPTPPISETLVLKPDTQPDPALPSRQAADWQRAVEAAHFLGRASFGVTAKDIQFILDKGKEAWLEQQLSTPLTSQVEQLDKRVEAYGYLAVPPSMYYDSASNGEWARMVAKQDVWWETVVWGSDQLRQRVVLALSQILVVSHQGAGMYARERGFANYTDILADQAFGSYEQLLLEVSLNPIMGIYLSAINNPKADPQRGIYPDENYAREILQLFSIGLEELNLDGSVKRDSKGNSIATYDQNTINEFARIFTGWSFSTNTEFAEGGEFAYWRTPISNVEPMKAFAEYHDSGPKTLLNGEIIPSGQTPIQDIRSAIGNIMAHPNVAPFISKKLIQHLITSNPSPAYVERVANVFNDNGSGVKGDMKAVIKAIYLDEELLLNPGQSHEYFGKRKESPLVIAGIWRSFKARGTPVTGPNNVAVETIQYLLNEPTEETFLYAPTVFNFYQTDYAPPGVLAQRKLYAPEFQVFGGAAAINQANLLTNLIYRRHYADEQRYRGTGQDWGGNIFWNNMPVKALLNLDVELTLADNPIALVDRVNLLLTQGQISEPHSRLIAEHISLLHDPLERVYESIFLIAISPEYAIQR